MLRPIYILAAAAWDVLEAVITSGTPMLIVVVLVHAFGSCCCRDDTNS